MTAAMIGQPLFIAFRNGKPPFYCLPFRCAQKTKLMDAIFLSLISVQQQSCHVKKDEKTKKEAEFGPYLKKLTRKVWKSRGQSYKRS